MPKLPTVAVFGVFATLEPAYSLVGVVCDQVRSLLRAGYPTQLWMLEDCNVEQDMVLRQLVEEYPELQVVCEIPHLVLVDYMDHTQVVGPEFEEQVSQLERSLDIMLNRVDIVLTHDILFQTWYLPHNIAVRRAALKHESVRWFHWMHSAPCERPDDVIYPHVGRFSGMPRSKFIYLNETDKARAAQMRYISERDVAIVPNSRDICDYLGMPVETKIFIRDNNLLNAEILVVYPTRVCPSKQLDKAVMMTAAMKSFNLDARIVFCNSYGTSKEELQMLEDLKELADTVALGRENVYFTSEFEFGQDRPWRVCCPSEVVRSLQQIADLFIIPSMSEACSLTTLEAALCRNLLVLNEDFPPMFDLFGHAALYTKFSSSLKTSTHVGPEGQTGPEYSMAYYRSEAGRIITELRSDKALASFSVAKRQYNADYTFRHYLEPILYGQK